MASKMLTTPNLKLLYYAHIYSHLVYGLGVWGTMASNRQIKKLFAIQKACIRIICKKKKNEPTILLFQKQQLVEISDLIKIETTKIGHRISTKQYPAPLLKLFNTYGGQNYHRYSTRNKKTPNIQKYTSQQFNNSFLCKSISLYRSLPLEMKKILKIKPFQ